MSDETTDQKVGGSRRNRAATDAGRIRWTFLALAIGFGLLFAYDLIEAISDLVGVPAQLAAYNEFLAELGVEPSTVPWVPLIVNAVLPIVGYVIAFLVARRRPILHVALVFALALAAVAALTLSMNVVGGMISA